MWCSTKYIKFTWYTLHTTAMTHKDLKLYILKHDNMVQLSSCIHVWTVSDIKKGPPYVKVFRRSAAWCNIVLSLQVFCEWIFWNVYWPPYKSQTKYILKNVKDNLLYNQASSYPNLNKILLKLKRLPGKSIYKMKVIRCGRFGDHHQTHRIQIIFSTWPCPTPKTSHEGILESLSHPNWSSLGRCVPPLFVYFGKEGLLSTRSEEHTSELQSR